MGVLLTKIMTDNFDRRKEELLDRCNMIDLVDALGLDRKGKVARCPNHDDQGRPNLAIFSDNVHCFACGFHADAFGLVAKVKGLDFKGSFDFLAGRYGLPLIGDLRKKGSGLGYRPGVNGSTVYPKSVKLPDSPSPTMGGDLGNDDQVERATVYPKSPRFDWDDLLPDDGRPWLPADLWREFETFAEAEGYFKTIADYRRRLGRAGDVFFVRGYEAIKDATDDQVERRSLRVEVFDALLELGSMSSTSPAGDWLHREKGISPATQDRFGLRFLDDPRQVAGELVGRFGVDVLLDLGIYAKGKDGKPYFVFKRHRLIFPFLWRGLPVDAQGRDVEAKGKGDRFRNTSGKNPIPYNADDLVEAKATGKPVFLCEGATDTLALAQSGRLVVGIVGTGGFKSAWLPAFEGLKVFVAFDSDEAGRKAAKDISRVFFDAGHQSPKVVKLPEGVKDINALFRGDQS